MKVAIFMMIMAGMLESMIGNRSFAWGQTPVPGIFFRYITPANDTMWTDDYKSSNISGIGGETLWIKYEPTPGNLVNINWIFTNTTPYPSVSDTIYNSSMVSYVLPDSTNGGIQPVYVYMSEYPGFAWPIDDFLFYSKFIIPQSPSASPVPDKNNPQLKLDSFNIEVYGMGSAYLNAYADSIYWYELDNNNIIIDSLTTDTGHIYQVPLEGGKYFIKLKVVFENTYGGGFNSFYRISNPSDTLEYDNFVFINSNYDNKEQSIKVYPNPVSDVLYISEEIEYSIFSITGQMILSSYGKEIDVSYFKPGMYFLRTINESHKFIVE